MKTNSKSKPSMRQEGFVAGKIRPNLFTLTNDVAWNSFDIRLFSHHGRDAVMGKLSDRDKSPATS